MIVGDVKDDLQIDVNFFEFEKVSIKKFKNLILRRLFFKFLCQIFAVKLLSTVKNS